MLIYGIYFKFFTTLLPTGRSKLIFGFCIALLIMGARALASSLQAGEMDFGLMGITVFFFIAAGDLLAGVMGDTTPANGVINRYS